MLLLAVPLGILVGITMGALGGGGSILTVPALVYLLGQTPHQATTASLVIVGLASLVAMAAHQRAGRVRLRQGLAFGALGVAGSWAGSRLSAHSDPDVLLAGFSGVLLLAAASMAPRVRRPAVAFSPSTGRTDPAGPSGRTADPAGSAGRTTDHAGSTHRPRVRPARVALAATLVGLLTGFFGVGGGFVIVPALVLVLGLEMPVAVGTSLLVITATTAVALATRLGDGVDLRWPLVATFTASAMAGSLAGSRVAAALDARRLTAGFVVLLLLVAAYTAARSVPQLL